MKCYGPSSQPVSGIKIQCYEPAKSAVPSQQFFEKERATSSELKAKTDNYTSRFQQISDRIEANEQQGADGLIIKNYQAKLDAENAQIVSSKNRFEVNQELVSYSAQQKVTAPRDKVVYTNGQEEEHESIESDDD